MKELSYRFRGRRSGSSKLDWSTVLEYVALLAEKASGHYVPSEFVLFGLVGASEMVVNLAVREFYWRSAALGLSAHNLRRQQPQWCGT